LLYFRNPKRLDKIIDSGTFVSDSYQLLHDISLYVFVVPRLVMY